jgi:hypothetical protein
MIIETVVVTTVTGVVTVYSVYRAGKWLVKKIIKARADAEERRNKQRQWELKKWYEDKKRAEQLAAQERARMLAAIERRKK